MLRALVVALSVVLLPAEQAHAQAPVREAYWRVGRDGAACRATISGPEPEDRLAVRVAGADAVLMVFKARPLRPGLTGALVIDGTAFSFSPEYDAGVLFIRLTGDGRLPAALREAADVSVSVDGQEVLHLALGQAGTDRALDGLAACAQGQRGWWGPGADLTGQGWLRNAEGAWTVRGDGGSAYCNAQLGVGDGALALKAARGRIFLAVLLAGPLRAAKAGRLEVDGARVPFTPRLYSGMVSNEAPLEPATVAAIGAARTLRVVLDNRAVLTASLDQTGTASLLDDLAACSRGRAGWWGEGAATVDKPF